MYNSNWRASIADGAAWVQSSSSFAKEDKMPQWIAELGVKGLSLAEHHHELAIPLAVSGNSVTTEFNPHPAHPRLFTTSGEELDELMQRWNDAWRVEGYYSPTAESLREVNKETLLTSINERKISLSELKFSSAAVSSTKPGLLNRIKRLVFKLDLSWQLTLRFYCFVFGNDFSFDIDFYTFIHHKLSNAESVFINSFLAIENREQWFSGAGAHHRGASSVWSPLQVSNNVVL